MKKVSLHVSSGNKGNRQWWASIFLRSTDFLCCREHPNTKEKRGLEWVCYSLASLSAHRENSVYRSGSQALGSCYSKSVILRPATSESLGAQESCRLGALLWTWQTRPWILTESSRKFLNTLKFEKHWLKGDWLKCTFGTLCLRNSDSLDEGEIQKSNKHHLLFGSAYFFEQLWSWGSGNSTDSVFRQS